MFFLFGCIWTVAPLFRLFTLGALWSLGEPEEDEGKKEEPEVGTAEQAEFNWA